MIQPLLVGLSHCLYFQIINHSFDRVSATTRSQFLWYHFLYYNWQLFFWAVPINDTFCIIYENEVKIKANKGLPNFSCTCQGISGIQLLGYWVIQRNARLFYGKDKALCPQKLKFKIVKANMRQSSSHSEPINDKYSTSKNKTISFKFMSRDRSVCCTQP